MMPFHAMRLRAPGAAPPPGSVWPTIADENSTFNDEGSSTSGWTTSNATMSTSAGWLRYTKNVASGTGSSSTSPAVTFTPTNRDYIIYGKVRARSASGDIGVIWLLNGSLEISIWLGTTAGNTVSTPGGVSFVASQTGPTRNVASLGTGYSYDTTAIEFALQYDSKFGTMTCWFREGDGRWKFQARLLCSWFSSANFQMLSTTGSASGMWVEFDYLTLAKPNIVAIGDSLCEGKNGFSPDNTLGLTNDESSWQRHALLYPSLRNNLIVNKGVGSQTSTSINSRIADATGEGPRVVVLHASSNDEGGAVSLATRTTNIQNSVNSITGASQSAVILNSSYGTSAGADNQPTPDLRDYMLDWWDNYKPTVTGAAGFIDIMQPVLSSGFLDAAKAADGIHPNVTGYEDIGDHIEAS
jgi:lysophospholipase L1-like esterase